jgi:hypothetical protein
MPPARRPAPEDELLSGWHDPVPPANVPRTSTTLADVHAYLVSTSARARAPARDARAPDAMVEGVTASVLEPLADDDGAKRQRCSPGAAALPAAAVRAPWMTDAIWAQHQQMLQKMHTPEAQAVLEQAKAVVDAQTRAD